MLTNKEIREKAKDFCLDYSGKLVLTTVFYFVIIFLFERLISNFEIKNEGTAIIILLI